MEKVIFFLLAGLLILIGFRHELRTVKKHGFWMFFAFEALLLLLFFNVDYWFVRATWWLQIISWVLLFSSALMALNGFYSLKKYGQPAEGWENTTRLIDQGIFRYIRHPLYASLILLSAGIFLKHITVKSIISCLFSLVFLVAASKVEEKENLAKFGAAYRDYMDATKNYFPFLI